MPVDDDEPYVLGLDIGGTKLAAGVVAPDGVVRSFLTTPSLQDGPGPALERLASLGREAVARSGLWWRDVGAVGIGCGGPLDPVRGMLVAPPHLPGWRDVPVVGWAKEEFDRPAMVENDASAAAIAEYRFGAGTEATNMVYLTISTGVGGGVMLGGELYAGSAGNGGEFGHVTVDRNGRRCAGCGRRGCLEAYASGTSITERAREAMAAGVPTTLPPPDRLTAADVSSAAAAGDGLARAVWDETTDALACGLTSIVNLFEPDLVVLGGGVTESGEMLFEPVRRRVAADAMAPAASAARIVPAALGRQVGVVGAAATVYERTNVRRRTDA